MFDIFKNKSKVDLEISRISKLGNRVPGKTKILNEEITFTDNLAFVDTYLEIFKNKIYSFNPSEDGNRLIIDGGANIGLSTIFFGLNYPSHHIIAFEPDPIIFEILGQNIKNFKLPNIELHNKAIWDKNETLTFYSDGSMSGSLVNNVEHSNAVSISAIRLKDFLEAKVDFLKLDIEGSELIVLKDCKDYLLEINNVFVEYHSYINKTQSLDVILKILDEAGFRYHLKESWSRTNPFIDETLICQTMDMAINIFAKRDKK